MAFPRPVGKILEPVHLRWRRFCPCFPEVVLAKPLQGKRGTHCSVHSAGRSSLVNIIIGVTRQAEFPRDQSKHSMFGYIGNAHVFRIPPNTSEYPPNSSRIPYHKRMQNEVLWSMGNYGNNSLIVSARGPQEVLEFDVGTYRFSNSAQGRETPKRGLLKCSIWEEEGYLEHCTVVEVTPLPPASLLGNLRNNYGYIAHLAYMHRSSPARLTECWVGRAGTSLHGV